MSEKNRIFVSYSRRHSDSIQLSKILVEKFKNDYDVFHDVSSIRTGEKWRQKLNHELCKADAGIILISEEAFESNWINKEVIVLDLWNSVRKNFVLYPILMSPLKSKNLKKGWISSLEVSEIENLKQKPGESLEVMAERIRSDFASKPLPEECVLADWVDMVRTKLEDADIKYKNRAAKILGIEHDNAGLFKDIDTELAYQLLLCEFDDLKVTFNELARGLKSDTDLKELRSLLAPRWVNIEAASTIPPVERLDYEKRNLAINADSADVGKGYILRAHLCDTNVFIAQTSGTTGLDPNDDSQLLEEFHHAIINVIGLDPDDDLDTVVAALKEMEQDSQSAFVLVGNRAVKHNIVKKLRDTYPGLVVLILSGSEFPDKNELGLKTLKCVRPELSKDDILRQRLFIASLNRAKRMV